jgi:DNA adenine methylase
MRLWRIEIWRMGGNMVKTLSPLRYPGGKSKIYEKVKNLVITNSYEDRTYVEPFAGGFGIGINLLCEGVVKTAILNDFDSHIYNFWHSVLNDTENLIRLISDTPITIEERENQKLNYADENASSLNDGFATLFLNRVNYSGVIKGGPIGGLSQQGKYNIDCRFNKEEIKSRIKRIAEHRDHISLYNLDASKLIANLLENSKSTSFFNIDPPYVAKGSKLYTNYFKESDHRNLGKVIADSLRDVPWITTYDDCELIREIYKQFLMLRYSIQHNVRNSIQGEEVVITNISKESFVW